jgi:predicted TPR repeat methyltransferase
MDQNFLNKISALINQGNFTEALDILKSSDHGCNNEAQYWEMLAIAEGMSGQNEKCKDACHHALKINPGNVVTYINLGVAQQNLGLLDDAEETLKKALSINAIHPQIHNNLGAIYILKSEYDKAKPYIEKALSLQPDYGDALNNMGEIFKYEHEYDNAIKCYLASINLSSNNIYAHIGLGTLYSNLARYDEAESHLNKALNINHYSTEALFGLGFIHYLKKSYDTAADLFNKTLKINPSHHNAEYLMSAITGKNSPDQSPEEYIKKLFDYYADNFDNHLLNDLGYNVPDKMLKVFTDHTEHYNRQHLLDLGCGTGICGDKFHDLFDHLTGVDLSDKMIEKSNEKNFYDELHNCDIGVFLDNYATEYDLVIAADVFVYIGNIAELVKIIYEKQKKNGYFMFSIESSFKHNTFHLRDTGRYSHNVSYIKTILGNSLYKIIATVPTTIRNEKGKGIQGVIFLCQK